MTAIGYFGGTFDPIHNGHLSIAQQSIEKLSLDSLYFLPAGNPWQRQPKASSRDRLTMVQLAAKNNLYFQVDNREIIRTGPTYTIDTLKEVREEHPSDTSIWLILGADAFLNLPTWRSWRDILKLANIAVACRPNYNLLEETLPHELKNLISKHLINATSLNPQKVGSIVIMEITETPVSSTEVRKLIHNKKDISSLVPGAVSDYIYSHHLYL